VIEKYIEVLLLSQQAEKDGLANSEKANTQLAMIRQNYLADLELAILWRRILLPMLMFVPSTTSKWHLWVHRLDCGIQD
jgi:hypothetical protein